MADPNFANVVLLLHLDGTAGSSVIVDNSSAARAYAAINGSLATAQAKFGSGSWPSGGTTFISYADSPDWTFSGQFTIEAFIYRTSTIGSVVSIVAQFGGTTDYGWFFGFNSGLFNFYYSLTGTDNPTVGASYTPPLNTWAHVAVDRDAGNVVRVYADGVVIASATVSGAFFNSSRTLRIANDEGNIRGFPGYVDEVRITKGVARYAGAFTPPTAPFDNTAAAQSGNIYGRTFDIIYGRSRPMIYNAPTGARTYAGIMGRTFDIIYGRPFPGNL